MSENGTSITLTLLGTGTSQGVPVIGCRCAVCRSSDSRDSRLRTSAMVEVSGRRIIIDAGPDFRQQMLREDVSAVSAILLTHRHKDHTGGIDDVRALNFVDYPTVRPVDIYATAETAACVRKDYDYAFAAEPYRGVPQIRLHEIDADTPFEVDGVEIIPVRGRHLAIDVVGFRIGSMAYMTDFKHIDEEQLRKIEGVQLLVINALRFRAHDSHFSVEEALDVVRRVGVKRAVLTHLSHEVGLHADVEHLLPEGVELGYDGMKFNI